MTSPSAAVLLYHRVAACARDPQELSVQPDRFREHLVQLSRLTRVVGLNESLQASSRTRVAITFDDGYVDNLTSAAKILADAEMRATVFVSTGYIGGHQFWWDRLERALFEGTESPDRIEIDVADTCVTIDVRKAAGRERAYWALHHRLRRQPASVIENVVRTMEDMFRPATQPPDGGRAMRPGELRDLASSGAFTVGAHAETHAALAALPIAEQRREVLRSREVLERLLGAPVTSFAYPFGDPGSFTTATEREVKRAGYQICCVNQPSAVRPRTNRLRVPRFLVRDWEGDVFAEHVAEWLRI